MFKEGVAIITLKEKYQKNKKTGEIYYLLTYSLQKTLTKKYFGLIGEKKPTLKDNQKPLFLFSEKRRWASGLHEGEVYLVEYLRKDKYLHVKDWRILGDKLSVERSWNVLHKYSE